MGNFRVETLDGGFPFIKIEGTVQKKDNDILRAISGISKTHTSFIINLVELIDADEEFFEHLKGVSARSKLKVISTNSGITSRCLETGLSTFPSLKSAQLSFAGDETVRLLLSKLRDVPILSNDAYKLVSYTNNENANYDELEKMIKDNPGLVSQILRVSNSSYFFRGQTITVLSQALITIGLTHLRRLFVFNFYNSVMGLFGSQKELIKHGKECAMLSEFISKAAGAQKTDLQKMWLGGLLHDVGGQSLAYFFPEKYQVARTLVKEQKMPTYLGELVTFGTEHQSIGKLLAHKWNFPDYLQNIIGDHHYLQNEEGKRLTLPVFCANTYLNNRDGLPAPSYEDKLGEYFGLMKKEIPWGDIEQEFETALEEDKNPF
ncbi:MAG: HDOD domain-containing protein [Candidatus Riflebacteria bacterium]|nr:HDOD domain-containing protein [Candidatus Riflebacteria bacterium]